MNGNCALAAADALEAGDPEVLSELGEHEINAIALQAISKEVLICSLWESSLYHTTSPADCSDPCSTLDELAPNSTAQANALSFTFRQEVDSWTVRICAGDRSRFAIDAGTASDHSRSYYPRSKRL